MNSYKPYKMICFFNDYEKWDDTIFDHAEKFHKSYSIYPNIMQASKETWDAIDKFANLFHPDLIYENELQTDEVQDEVKSISSFVTEDFAIEFCLDKTIKENYFVLVFDEDPSFDGEPVEDFADEEEVIRYRRIA